MGREAAAWVADASPQAELLGFLDVDSARHGAQVAGAPAVREAVANAVAHADYSHVGGPIRLAMFDDWLEVDSPGLLAFGLTVEDLPRGLSKLRNRVIGRVFHELG
jgi:hypothetical protein